MSTQLPFRSMRIPALQRQCLYLRHRSPSRPLNLSLRQPTISTARAFSSTPSRPAKHKAGRQQLGIDRAQTRAAARSTIGPAPAVGMAEAQSDVDSMQQDIGLLQNTMIRAPFRELWKHGLWTWPVYFWKLVKSKGTGLYSRFLYRTCVQKKGWDYYTPIDYWEWKQFKYIAKRHYEHVYNSFAAGNVRKLKDTCLPPFLRKIQSQIAVRGGLRVNWKIHGNIAARIVSHRASPLGESHPDTAYRQLVVRLKSKQSITRTKSGRKAASSSSTGPRRPSEGLPWMPDAAREQMQRERKAKAEGHVDGVELPQENDVFFDTEVPTTVVEYLVLQKRVIRGVEEDWKVWGFTRETTPELLKQDEEYFRKMLDYQTG
ncbi:Tim44 domain containing protein [Pyrenophora tritici-repentis]|uniref:Tim44 domain containing protein n=2 Tax=Pyrenophora tritici-repentis TaxID=45151 RepID=A0A2W1DZQ7_9PLEO|nr:uncharacterized protein PTRG_07332 [Pyrenophora tritici-repentis Pt-1C-BFP]KAA8614915.1 Tim44 domain-containing protein [Pyrenophora tritici-repentis]EDU50251.1 conserved hypothetical protein [Pyrenophora tritici-repentis Pt-1C-BFP]KAF7564599.1 Tim44 domain containing protein [Pyrenophora tritici-repentis]KAI0589262.1 Tim44 domain-containing protein [Pyrenophora tritici-repentis]KAI1511295.1 Tim44 domain containing protein [Pyrenophora tritici-repentis]